MSTEKLMDRPIPTLAEWLAQTSSIAQAADFEEWLRTSIDLERAAQTELEAMSVRMIHTLSVACVEACRIETEQHGSNYAEVTIMLPRAAGVAAIAAVMSTLRDDAPLMKIARVLTAEFEYGAKSMARATLRHREAAEAVQ